FPGVLAFVQAVAVGSPSFGQLPVLRSVPIDSAARPVVPPVRVTETESVPVVVAARPAFVPPRAGAEYSLVGQILRTKQVDVRPAGDKLVAILLDTGDGQRQ